MSQHRVPRTRRHTVGQSDHAVAPVSGPRQAVYPRVSQSSLFYSNLLETNSLIFPIILLLRIIVIIIIIAIIFYVYYGGALIWNFVFFFFTFSIFSLIPRVRVVFYFYSLSGCIIIIIGSEPQNDDDGLTYTESRGYKLHARVSPIITFCRRVSCKPYIIYEITFNNNNK